MSLQRRFSYEEEDDESKRVQELTEELLSILGEGYRQIILHSPQRVAPVSKLERAIETLRGQHINELFGEPIRYVGEETLFFPGIPYKERSRLRTRGGAHKLTSHYLSTGQEEPPIHPPTETQRGTESPQGRDKEQAP